MCAQEEYAPSVEQRVVAREHVIFEIRMFREVVRQHDAAQRGRPRDLEGMCRISALRDSALLHARNLHDFFLNARKQDDIVAADFVDSSNSDWSAAPLLATLAREIPDVNKFRSHLTYTRTERTRSWPLATFSDELESAFREFIQKMPAAERSAWRESIDSPDWRPTRQQRGFVPRV